MLQDGSYTYVHGLGLISQTDNSGNQSYFLGNGLGSTEALTDGTGNVVATYKYDAFGAVRSTTGGSTEYRFTGQQDDADLGYTCLRARYYDPATGRFISKDPFPGLLGNPGTLNPYVYALNSPANYTDPSGKIIPFIVAAIVIGGIIGGGVYAATDEGYQRTGRVDYPKAAMYVVGGELLFAGGAAAVTYLGPAVTAAISGGGTAAVQRGQAAANTCSSKVDEAATAIEEWLGPNARVMTNKAGDKIFQSADGLRKFRTDIIDFGEHPGPHAHFQVFNGNRWVSLFGRNGPKQIYPKGPQ